MSLQRLARIRRFWTDFFWQTEPDGGYPQLAGRTIRFTLAGGYKLSLSLDEGLHYFSLGFTAPRQETVEIAWDDQAHWHPHVLRWQELELICRAIALQDSRLAHPGLVLLLLHRFAPICVGDDLDVIVPMLETAWRQLDLFSDSEIARWIERADARDAGFAWRYHEEVGGWCIEQDGERAARGLYTLRDAGNKEFPFAQWARMIAAAEDFVAQARVGAAQYARIRENGRYRPAPAILRSLRDEKHAALAGALGDEPPLPRVCWVVETLLGLPAGSLVKRHVRRACSPRAKHVLSLTLPLRDRKRPLPSAAGKLVRDTLDRILKDLNLGEADVSGATSTTAEDGSHVYIDECLSVRIDGDLDRGIRVLRDVLWWAGAPQSVRLTDSERKPVPLDLVNSPQKPGERYLRNRQAPHRPLELRRRPRTPLRSRPSRPAMPHGAAIDSARRRRYTGGRGRLV